MDVVSQQNGVSAVYFLITSELPKRKSFTQQTMIVNFHVRPILFGLKIKSEPVSHSKSTGLLTPLPRISVNALMFWCRLHAGGKLYLYGLTFSSSTFAITSSSFTMSTTPGNVVGQPFTLQVTFTAPQGFTGSNPLTVAGTISSLGNGAVIFEWNPFSQSFSFNDSKL